MRFFHFLLLVFIGIIPCAGQTIFNTHQISAVQENYIYSHSMDPLGNKYLHIYSQGGMPMTIYGKSYNLDQGTYIFRFDASDSLTRIYDIWREGLGDVQAIAADKYGNMYLAGIVGNGYVGYFGYTKISADGEVLWQLKSPEGLAYRVDTKQILIDDEGNSYVSGNVETPVFFGVRLYKYVVYPAHDFLLKISPSGSLSWMHTSDASDNDIIVSGMRFDNYGNVIVGGSFNTELKIGASVLSNSLGSNYYNLYMICISPSGDMQWLKGFTGPGNFYMLDLEVDANGNFYFCGQFAGSMKFGDVELTTRPWRDQAFIMGKLSNNFDVEWIKYNDANNTSSGGYLANTSDGILLSGAFEGRFYLDNLTLPASPSNRYQAFVAKVLADGTVSWLKGYGDALQPGSYSETPTHHYFYPGYQLTRVTDQCYFISGNFVNTLDTNDGLVTTKARAVFTGIFTESESPYMELGPDISTSLCVVDTCTIPLSSTLGTNLFSTVQGTMPTITFVNESSAKLSNIGYGVTKLKWIVQNCTSVSSKMITINRIDSTVQKPSTTSFCKSQLDNAAVTVSGAHITWYDNESLINILKVGNTFVPTNSDTVYVTNGVEGCISKPTKIIISVTDDPMPPNGQTTQIFSIGETLDDLIVSGNNINWYTSSGIKLSPTTILESDSTYYATQTVSGCESQPFPVKVSIITAVEDYNLSLLYYPNPAKDNLIISSNKRLNLVVVKDVLGQTLITKDVYTNTTEVELATLKSGIYFIQVDVGEMAKSFKIAKE